MEKIRLRDIVELLILPLMTAAVIILWDMNKSINLLNVQVGVILTDNATQKEELKELKTRVYALEKDTQK